MNKINLGGKVYNIVKMDIVRKNNQEIVQMVLTDPTLFAVKVDIKLKLKRED